jgi:hypothetical protein
MSAITRREFAERSLLLTGLPWLSGMELLAAGPKLTAGEKLQLTQHLFPKGSSTEEAVVFSAPNDSGQWPAFRRLLHEWREKKRVDLQYSDRLYRREDFQWVPSSYACCFLMVYDLRFYNPEAGRYQVEEFLDDGVRRLGG